MRTLITLWALTAAIGLAQPAAAEDAWSELRPEIYAERVIAPAGDLVTLSAPRRSSDDRRTPLGAEVRAPDGAAIRSIALIIDENPMPVSAVFDFAEPQNAFTFSAEMRMNGPSPVRVVMETEDGGLYMSETLVKTSGVGACAAAPGADVEVALKTLGQMELTLLGQEMAEAPLARLAALGDAKPQPAAAQARLDIMHPSHSGMQMDQISLLFIPARFIDTVEVSADDQPLFTMTGSISLSENPSLTFNAPATASSLTVRLRDTEETEVEKVFPLPHI